MREVSYFARINSWSYYIYVFFVWNTKPNSSVFTFSLFTFHTMDDLIRLSSNISEAIGSLNLFPTSQINVGLGNTLISMTFFGVGPSVVAYTALKILEENDKTKTVIPFSHPATFPVAAFAMNRLFNLSLSSLCCLGLLYVGFQYLRNNQFPAQAAVGFNKYSNSELLFTFSVMSAVTSFFNKAIQRSRYSVTEMGAIINYVVYLPQGVMRVCSFKFIVISRSRCAWCGLSRTIRIYRANFQYCSKITTYVSSCRRLAIMGRECSRDM